MIFREGVPIQKEKLPQSKVVSQEPEQIGRREWARLKAVVEMCVLAKSQACSYSRSEVDVSGWSLGKG